MIAARLRLLSFPPGDGPDNMAWDEALLQAAAGLTLRLYSWQPTTVSLGCFQEYAPIAAVLPAGLPLVRRITGGGAIWHQHEVTYALVGSFGQDGLPTRMVDLHAWIHQAIAQALAGRGIHLSSQTVDVGDRRYRQEPRCFAAPAAGDLMAAGGGKVLGSAGRARGPRFLVHGSFKLASNPWDGPATAGCGLEDDEARSLMAAAFAGRLAAIPAEDRPTAAEQEAFRLIRQARYGDDLWVRERRGLRP